MTNISTDDLIYSCVVEAYRACLFDVVIKNYAKFTALVADKDNDEFYLYEVPFKFSFSRSLDKDGSLNIRCHIDCLDAAKFNSLLPKYRADAENALNTIISQGKEISKHILKNLKKIIESNGSTDNNNKKDTRAS